jgi:hypothetical protein
MPRALCLVAPVSTVRVVAQGNGEMLRIASLDFRAGTCSENSGYCLK